MLLSILNFWFSEFIIHIFVIVSHISESFFNAKTVCHIRFFSWILLNFGVVRLSFTLIFITARSNQSSNRTLSKGNFWSCKIMVYSEFWSWTTCLLVNMYQSLVKTIPFHSNLFVVSIILFGHSSPSSISSILFLASIATMVLSSSHRFFSIDSSNNLKSKSLWYSVISTISSQVIICILFSNLLSFIANNNTKKVITIISIDTIIELILFFHIWFF